MTLTANLYKEETRNEIEPLTRADGNLTLQQFFDLLYYTLDIAKPNLVFAPAYPKYLLPDTPEFKATMEHPTELFRDTVTYLIIREEPGSVGGDKQPFGTGRREIVPRVREIITGADKSRIQYGQWMDTLVQFDIWTLTNYEAEVASLWFKRFMTTRRGFFKQMGLSEMLFWWRGRDLAATQVNNNLHVRSLIYFIRTEELSYEEDYNLKQLEIKIEKVMTK